MVTFENKILLFQKSLDDKNDSYGDFMKDEIYFYFFENENSLDFLKELKSELEINNKVDFLVSKMIRHEHEEGLYNIISNYI